MDILTFPVIVKLSIIPKYSSTLLYVKKQPFVPQFFFNYDSFIDVGYFQVIYVSYHCKLIALLATH